MKNYKEEAVGLIDEFEESYRKSGHSRWDVLAPLVVGKAIVYALLQIASNINNIAYYMRRKN